MKLMHDGAMVPENQGGEETLTDMTELRSEIMAAYPCILQGIGDSGHQQQLVPYVQGMFEVVQTVVAAEEDEEVIGHTVGLLGDLAAMYGNQIAGLINQYQQPIQKCLTSALQDSDEQTRQTAQFAQQQINNAVR